MNTWEKSTWRMAGALLAVIVIGLAGPIAVGQHSSAAPGPVEEQTLDLAPEFGFAGSLVTATAGGFARCPPAGTDDGAPGGVAFLWDDDLLLKTDSTAGDGPSVTFEVPADASAGGHTVVARCVAQGGGTVEEDGLTVSRPFGVTSLTIVPDAARVGEEVEAIAEGFAQCPPTGLDGGNTGTVAFQWDGPTELGQTGVVPSDGSAAVTIDLQDVEPGDYTVVAQCVDKGGAEVSTSGPAASATLSVSPATDPPTEPTPETDTPTPTELAEVPDLRGLTIAEANDELVARGLELGDKAGSQDVVRSQDPRPGEMVPIGSKVTVSTGGAKPVRTVPVPDVVAMTQTEAEQALGSKGLVLVVGSGTEGRVSSQEPSAGVRIPRGDEVTVVLSEERSLLLVALVALVGGAGLAAPAAGVAQWRRSADRRWLRANVQVRAVLGTAAAVRISAEEVR